MSTLEGKFSKRFTSLRKLDIHASSGFWRYLNLVSISWWWWSTLEVVICCNMWRSANDWMNNLLKPFLSRSCTRLGIVIAGQCCTEILNLIMCWWMEMEALSCAILVSRDWWRKERRYRSSAEHRLTWLQRSFKTKGTKGSGLIFGPLEFCYTLWFKAQCLLKLRI